MISARKCINGTRIGRTDLFYGDIFCRCLFASCVHYYWGLSYYERSIKGAWYAVGEWKAFATVRMTFDPKIGVDMLTFQVIMMNSSTVIFND